MNGLNKWIFGLKQIEFWLLNGLKKVNFKPIIEPKLIELGRPQNLVAPTGSPN